MAMEEDDENGTSCILRFAMKLLIKYMVHKTQIKSASENNKLGTGPQTLHMTSEESPNTNENERLN